MPNEFYKIEIKKGKKIINTTFCKEYYCVYSDFKPKTRIVFKGIGTNCSFNSIPKKMGWLHWLLIELETKAADRFNSLIK